MLWHVDVQGNGGGQEITEITADEWDSLQYLLCDDVSVKSELSPSLSVGPELDCTVFPPVLIQPVSANVVNVPVSASVVGGEAATAGVGVVNGSNFNVVLNSQVKIRPKPLAVLGTSTSLPASKTGAFLLDDATQMLLNLG